MTSPGDAIGVKQSETGSGKGSPDARRRHLIASERHVVAVVDDAGGLFVKPIGSGEDAGGHGKLFDLLGGSTDVFVAMEATGHCLRILFAPGSARVSDGAHQPRAGAAIRRRRL